MLKPGIDNRRPEHAAVLALVALLAIPAADASAVGFSDVSVARGVVVTINGTARDDWGYGAAFVDYDGDGRLDLYVATENDSPNRLFQQQPDGTFIDVATAAGVGDMENGRAVKFADFDNDGDQDFFLGNYRGPNRLYRNNGDGTFTDVADSALAGGRMTFGAAWGDCDADGFVDLYVVNRRLGGEEGVNQFFHNRGADGFVERAAELGLDDEKAGLEAVWFDYDNDGDADLYLSNDKFGGNRLWCNDGGGTFTDVSIESRSNVTINSMGVALGDYDGNGYVDIYLTNTSELSSIKNVLLHNNGDGTFDNLAMQLDVLAARYGWGTAFFDFDNDADQDLYVVNWDIQPGDPAARNQLFRNNGVGPFSEVGEAYGASDDNPGYGLCVGDFDDNGYLDMFVTNNGARSVLFRNTFSGRNWLKVRTVGTSSNRDGIGARVSVSGPRRQFRDIDGGSSYLCHHDKVAHFGIATADVVDTVEVAWPSGWVDAVALVGANQTLTVVEGSSVALGVLNLRAATAGSAVRLTWDVTRDVGIAGFRVYRRDAASGEETLLDEGLPGSEREYIDRSDVVPGAEYEYTIAAVDAEELGGSEWRSLPADVSIPVTGLRLMQNFPNPFHPITRIEFVTPVAGPVRLTIHDSRGRLVQTIVDTDLGAGPHSYTWAGFTRGGGQAASGVYYYRLETGRGVLTRKMILVR